MGKRVSKISLNNMNTIYFNELSYKNQIKDIEYELVMAIKFLMELGIKTCKFTRNDRNVFLQLKRENKSLALSFFKMPFETSYENPASEDIEYVLNEWLYDNIKTIGFSYAINTKSLVLSFYNNGFDESKYNIYRKDEKAEVFNISNKKNYEDIKSYIEKQSDTTLIESKYSFTEKLAKSKFPTDHHHGTKALEKYLNNILKIPYVDYVANSVILKSNAKFVSYDLNKQAIIVRLIWEDGNPGYVVKCTARNEYEYKIITDYLNKNLPKYKQEY